MNTNSDPDTIALTADAVTDALRHVPYPGLTRDLVSFGMVEHVEVHDGMRDGAARRAHPRRGRAREARAEHRSGAAAARRDGRDRSGRSSQADHRAAVAARHSRSLVGAGSARERAPRDRGRRGKGRRRQEHRGGEPRPRAGARRTACRPPRRRHLRAEPADPARHRGRRVACAHVAGEDDPAALRARSPDDQLRLLPRRRIARHLARAKGVEGREAVRARRGVARAGRPRRRSPAGNGRHPGRVSRRRSSSPAPSSSRSRRAWLPPKRGRRPRCSARSRCRCSAWWRT